MSDVTSDPARLGGVAVFAGTRVPVKCLFDALIAGDAVADFLDDFPTVTADQVRSVLEKVDCPQAMQDYSASMTEGISIDPAVCHGKPVIKGTRVLVSTVLGALAGGDSREEVERDYGITSEQVSAALQFASDMAGFQMSAYDAVA